MNADETAGWKMDRQARQTYRQTDRQADRQTDRGRKYFPVMELYGLSTSEGDGEGRWERVKESKGKRRGKRGLC